MKQQDLAGAVIDGFRYDTPEAPQQDFYALCEDVRPLVLIFLPNYGHPISRVFLTRYRDTRHMLKSGRLACVVRSDPEVIAARHEDAYAFPLICDRAGALYEYFHVESTASRFKWSVEAIRIFRQAAGQGYVQDKAAQQLPLTLIVGQKGKILFSHYGQSLTDMPEDCTAIERVCARLVGQQAAQTKHSSAEKLPEDAPPCFTREQEEARPLSQYETTEKGKETTTESSPSGQKPWSKLLDMFEESEK